MEPLRRSYVYSWHLPASPAAKLVPSVVICTPLGPISEAERGSRRLGNPGPPYISPRHVSWRVSLHSRLTATAQHGRQQFTGYKSISIGVERRTPRDGRHGLPSTVGEFILFHWTATARLKPGSPPSAKVLSRHGPPASMGAWSLGYLPDK